MSRLIIQQTQDGSATLFRTDLNASFHSTKGALSESKHVFIEAGLNFAIGKFGNDISVFEMGFGSGLNALLTMETAMQKGIKVQYETIEQYPVTTEIAAQFSAHFNQDPFGAHFMRLHGSEWNETITLQQLFRFKKERNSMEDHITQSKFHCIYYDAFSPDLQPELWTEKIFLKLKEWMYENGCLVTYCAKGEFKRMLKGIGLKVETLPGAPGKREMVRAIKV